MTLIIDILNITIFQNGLFLGDKCNFESAYLLKINIRSRYAGPEILFAPIPSAISIALL